MGKSANGQTSESTSQRANEVTPESVEAALIRRRIAELTQQREAFVSQANQQIAAFNGAIQALEALLQPEMQAAETPAAPTPEAA